jgi:hypothetical protein
MDGFIAFLDLLLLWIWSRNYVFWALIAFIAIGLVAVAANLMEPGRPSF